MNLPDSFDTEGRNYRKKCQTTIDQIKEIYDLSKRSFSYYFNSNGYMVLIVDQGSTTILPEDPWKQIKKKIDQKISRSFEKEPCPLCGDKIIQNVSCVRCSSNRCLECYIKGFREGSGIFRCFRCGYSMGRSCSKEQIESGVQKIRTKAAKAWQGKPW